MDKIVKFGVALCLIGVFLIEATFMADVYITSGLIKGIGGSGLVLLINGGALILCYGAIKGVL